MSSTDETTSQRGKPVATLTRENHEKWFAYMRKWLISKDCWRPIEAPDSKHELAFAKIDATAQYWITQCISEDDQDRFIDVPTAEALWNALQAKYNRTLPSQRRQLIHAYTNFQMTPGQTISDAWGQLQQLGKKIAASDKSMVSLTKPETRIQQLLSALPEEYATYRMSIDSQKHLEVDEILSILEEAETQFQTVSTTAFYAKGRQGPIECHVCKKDHFVKDCPSLPIAQRAVKEERRRKRSSQSLASSSSQERTVMMKDLEVVVAKIFQQIMDTKAKSQSKVARKERAYKAEETSATGSSTSKSPTTVSFDDQVSYEIAHLSKDVT
ncbi:hypothetical protein KCU91_g19053, partial [Aureobasidium melanogenum]